MFQTSNYDYISSDEARKIQDEVDKQARDLQKAHSMSGYIRSSALLGCNVKNIFDQIIM